MVRRFMLSKRTCLISAGLLIYDLAALYFAFYAALYCAYGCSFSAIPADCLSACLYQLPFLYLACVLVFCKFRLYNSLWYLVSYYELFSFSFAVLLPVFCYFLLFRFIESPLPKRYFLIGGWIYLWMILTLRFSYRFLVYLALKLNVTASAASGSSPRKRAMLIGAGAAGQIILRDVLACREANTDIVCIIDDDPGKLNCYMSGVQVVGGRDDILLNVKKYGIEEILFAVPTVGIQDKRNILAICQESGCKLRILPGIYSLVNGEVSLAKMREVTIEELLGRDTVKINSEGILDDLRGKVVLVTGGGGSIGSELCRQIAKHCPKQLIIFDIYENNAYAIEQELRRDMPELNLLVLIGSVRDTRRIRQVFAGYSPEIVFHAAAHKHVPLMETSPCEAIKNNVLGTYKTAHAAILYGTKRFVLISTDKAVNPVNIMGASKRLCEMVVQSLNRIVETGKYRLLPKYLSLHNDEYLEEKLKDGEVLCGRTEFVAVRFGNVLGSNGSVIPLFKEQIKNGGPVTVTHPDIIRYFMTIPEAASLVLEAASFARGGEIFVLDMGEPVKIDTLARNLIKLSGFKPDVDIKIEYSGLRPGEKLYEEKLMSEEGLERTKNELIHVAKPLDWDIDSFMEKLENLARAAYENKADIRTFVADMVPTYTYQSKEK